MSRWFSAERRTTSGLGSPEMDTDLLGDGKWRGYRDCQLRKCLTEIVSRSATLLAMDSRTMSLTVFVSSAWEKFTVASRITITEFAREQPVYGQSQAAGNDQPRC